MTMTTNADKLKPRLVTVYKLTYPGMEQIQQYYKYDFESGDENEYVPECPGCGKNLKYKAMEHKCPGSRTAHPVDAAYRAARSGTKKTKDRLLNHYVTQATHPIVLDE